MDLVFIELSKKKGNANCLSYEKGTFFRCPQVEDQTNIELSSLRLHSPQLSEAQNKEIFGKCNNKNGHGHNYNVEVTVRGEVIFPYFVRFFLFNKVDSKTGMVMNLVDLKNYMKEVIDKLDHKHLDEDISYFKEKGIPSTTENLAIYFWDELLRLSLPKALLFEVKIFETENNIIFYRGD